MIRERVLTGIISLALLGLMLFFASSLFTQIFIAFIFLFAAWEFSKFFNFPEVRRRYFFVFLFGCFQIFFYLIFSSHKYGKEKPTIRVGLFSFFHLFLFCFREWLIKFYQEIYGLYLPADF